MVAYTVRAYGEGKKYWSRIGTVFPHKDGKEGFNIELDAFPTDGKIVVLPKKENDEEPAEG